MKICADLHLVEEQFIEIFFQERVNDSFEPMGGQTLSGGGTESLPQRVSSDLTSKV